MFAGDVEGRIFDDLPGGYAFFDNPNFVDEFGKRNVVKVSGEKGHRVDIGLGGTKRAIDAIKACQKQTVAVRTATAVVIGSQRGRRESSSRSHCQR